METGTLLLEVRDERQLRALTGVNEEPLEILVKTFEELREANLAQQYEEAVARGERSRRPGGGRKGVWSRSIDAVRLVRFYLKTYPTFEVLGSRFGLSRTRAHANFYQPLALLEGVLGDLGLMPTRECHTVAEFQQALAGAEVILIEVTERDQQRPSDPDTQQEECSGKKKRHTLKNTVISNTIKSILSGGRTFPGPHHDYHLMKSEFLPGVAWFNHLEVYVDLGYQGIRKDYPPAEIKIPQNRPRKSHKNPTPSLSEEEQRYNQ
ncbi:MAG: hypothetical protein BWK78_10145 [Thiotrichaceae bacterium IS1]|nr:MAG: hypothetical protein BWK78_10145 [Thiotrichaceae bacterium IS1]